MASFRAQLKAIKLFNGKFKIKQSFFLIFAVVVQILKLL